MSATTVAWIYLFIAGLLEAFWAIGLKYSEGFSKPIPTILTLCLVVSSFFLLSKAMKVLPVSFTYAIWCAIGIVSLVLIEYFYLNGVLNFQKIISILFILIGIVGLKIS
ncbi:putative multidrug efflux system protein [Aliarcobacter butzleri 7h1h]|jgi:quaternary ammonium compound-resistance protein SugE|uniref:Guanidinium exporter n=1 Tax=Arcobacter ellisii TaxID=913109 RepID=A0A347U999_9BACT|nr:MULTISPECIES: multidrug efflux SMR transporter [Arcobacteraceae]AGR77712.1 putative multidrug efflux system protein [Aliarcobacter butzleri 7h1h]AXX95427.1 QacE family quaternary ammonium compound efflux SMR transporter [Arcobacter ellisii]MCT7585590.1 multidrug efflux SMR transporter [Aliarcobacter butzleri]MCT7908673.1 multidrug efflux SMR transporter [Arcobacter lacus]RXI29922.1 QacE family quaternary ammonium compound efflux SMR transporter [Arcobacter ellisii]